MVIFQFHKGTIRTVSLTVLSVLRIHFNSIKVQLEQFDNFERKYGTTHFNSIKVQLERGKSTVARKLIENFNSIKVQLERLPHRASAVG